MIDSQTEEPNIQPDNKQHPPLKMGFGFLPRLFTPGWSKLAFQLVRRCPEYFLKPALLLAFALTAPYLEIWALNGFLTSMSDHRVFQTGGDILTTFGPIFLGLIALAIGAFVSIAWGLGALLIALTATCRTILLTDTQTLDTTSIATAMKSAQEEGIQQFRSKKGFLAKVWLIYSVLMLLPTAIMVITSWILMLGMPQVGSYTMLPMHMNIPTEMMIGSAILLGVSITVLSNYALILFPFSAVSTNSAAKAALGGFIATLKTLPAISIYSIIFFVLSFILSSPVDLLLVFNQQLITGPLSTGLFLALKFFWHALFFVYLVPISILIPCEMIRGNIE